jgi:hypothetical protein
VCLGRIHAQEKGRLKSGCGRCGGGRGLLRGRQVERVLGRLLLRLDHGANGLCGAAYPVAAIHGRLMLLLLIP